MSVLGSPTDEALEQETVGAADIHVVTIAVDAVCQEPARLKPPRGASAPARCPVGIARLRQIGLADRITQGAKPQLSGSVLREPSPGSLNHAVGVEAHVGRSVVAPCHLPVG